MYSYGQGGICRGKPGKFAVTGFVLPGIGLKKNFPGGEKCHFLRSP
jgi:hypothetical protein